MQKLIIGRIISNIRMKRGFSQEYVAFTLGISQKTFSRIEQDGESISLSKLKKISDILDLDLLQLISFYIDDNNKPDIDTIINRVDKTCNQVCLADSCPYEKTIHQLKVEVEKLKNEL